MAETPKLRPGARRTVMAIRIAVALGVLTLVGAIWLAATVQADTRTVIEMDGNTLTITGPDAEVLGSVSGLVGSRQVTIRGLPAVEAIEKDPAARRAVCTLRDDPLARWTEPTSTIRAHLNREGFEEICAVYSAV